MGFVVVVFVVWVFDPLVLVIVDLIDDVLLFDCCLIFGLDVYLCLIVCCR